MTNQMVAGTLATTAGGSLYAAWIIGNTVFAQSDGVSGTHKLTEFGVAGSLMAVIVYIVYLLLNRTLSGRETDLAWHREEMARRTTLFQSVIDEQTRLNERNMTHLVDKLSNSLEKLDVRLGSRSEDILKILEAMRSVNLVMDDVKDMLLHCRDVQRVRISTESKQIRDEGKSDR